MLFFYSCLQCKIYYDTKLQILDHNKEVHGESPFPDIDIVGMKTDDTELFEELECQYCGEVSSIHEHLAKHIASVHPKQIIGLMVKNAVEEDVLYGLGKVEKLERDPFPCTKCDKIYQTKRALKDHKQYKHGAPSTCRDCRKFFSSKLQLGSHVRDSHSPRLHTCALCGKKFSRKRDLERHLVPCCRGKGRKTSRRDSAILFHE